MLTTSTLLKFSRRTEKFHEVNVLPERASFDESGRKRPRAFLLFAARGAVLLGM